MRSDARATWATVLIPAAVATLAHAWSLGEPFVAEDFAFVVEQHARLRSADGSLLGWLPDISGRVFFRPVIELSLALEYGIWGARPAGYHAVNVLLFALVCGLTAAVAWRLTRVAFVATLSGVLVALSPVAPENVVWITGREGVFPVVFLLLAARATWTERRARLLLAAPAWFFLGLLSKEWVVATAPVLVALRVLALRGGPAPWSNGLRSTALVWIGLGAYLVLRVVTIGELVGGYGVGSGIARGVVVDRVDYLLGLVLQVPERVVGGAPRYAAALLLGLGLLVGLRRAAARIGPDLRGVAWLCVLWIGAVMCAHLPVPIGPEEFIDVRYLFPALPPMCVLLSAACWGFGRARGTLALVLVVASTAGSIASSRDWWLAGRAGARLHAAALALHGEREHATLEIHGLPPTLGQAHFGICLASMFEPPLFPARGMRVRVYGDLFVPHRGLQRSPSFHSLLAAVRDPRPGAGVAWFDREARALRLLPMPEARFSLRGRIAPGAGGTRVLRCTDLPLDFTGSGRQPAVGDEVRLQGRLSADRGPRRFLVESVADAAVPILSLQRRAGTRQVMLTLAGPAGSYFSVFTALASAAHAVPGCGVLLVDTAQPCLRGQLDRAGAFATMFDLGGLQGALPGVQAVLFTPDGDVVVSGCRCLR